MLDIVCQLIMGVDAVDIHFIFQRVLHQFPASPNNNQKGARKHVTYQQGSRLLILSTP